MKIDFGTSNRTVELRSVVSGTKLSVDASGTVLLAAANTFTGGVNLLGGTLSIGNNSALGTGLLQMNDDNVTLYSTGNYTLANDVSVLGNRYVRFGASTALTLTGSIDLAGSGTNEFQVASDRVKFAGVISGGESGGIEIRKSQGGSLTLSGANTFSGSVRVNGGYLLLANRSALGDSANVGTIANNATLFFLNGVGNSSTATQPLWISGDGVGVGAQASGVLRNDSNVSTRWTGVVTLTGNAVIGMKSGGVLQLDKMYSNDGTMKVLDLGGKGTFKYLRKGVSVKLRHGANVVVVPPPGVNQLVVEQPGPIEFMSPLYLVDDDPEETWVPTVTLEDSYTIAESLDTGTIGVTGRVDTAGWIATVGGPVMGSGTLDVVGGGTLVAQHFRSGALTITSGAAAISSNGSDSGTSRVSHLGIAGGTTPTAKLDLADNDLVLDYDSTSPIATARSQIAAAYTAGTWGGNGINTSVGNTGTLGLGIAEASVVLSFSGGTATFSGQVVDNTTVLIKSTWYGDANLDGQVDANDLARLSTYWQLAGHWSEADFNYDDFIDIADLSKLSTNWQMGVGGPRLSGPRPGLYQALLGYPSLLEAALNDPYLNGLLAGGDRGLVPEPSTAAAVAAMSVGLARRNRRLTV